MNIFRRSIFTLLVALAALAPSCGRTVYAQTVGLGPGLGQNVNPFDPANVKAAMIAGLTAQADADNARAAAAYLQTAQDWLTNAVSARDSKAPIPVISDPPLKAHVDQKTGVKTFGPDLVASKPALPLPSGDRGSGTIANPNAPPDRIDAILQGLAPMYDLLLKIQADAAAIKLKLGIQ